MFSSETGARLPMERPEALQSFETLPKSMAFTGEYPIGTRNFTLAETDAGDVLPEDGILMQAVPAVNQFLGKAAAEAAAKQIAFNMMLILFSKGQVKCDATDFDIAWRNGIGEDEDCKGLTGTDKAGCKHRNNLREYIRDTYALVSPAQKGAIWWEVRRQFIDYCKEYSD